VGPENSIFLARKRKL